MLRKALCFGPQVFLAAFLLVGVPNLAFSDTPATGATGGESSAAGGGPGGSSASQDSGGSASATSSGDNGAASADSSSSASGQGGAASAGADTTANANATVQDGVSNADATATASAGAGHSDVDLEAHAEAEFGGPDPNSASAYTTENGVQTTSASAVRGQSANATTANPNGYSKTKVSNKKTVAIAIQPDGSYSVAIATRKGSYAAAGAYEGSYKSITRQIMSAAKGVVGAYALATRDNARAGAGSASGGFASKGPFGWAGANARSYAFACVGSSCAPPPAQVSRPVVIKCQWDTVAANLDCPHAQVRRTDAFGHPVGDPRYGTLGR
jgi:hypothetical protein